MKPEATAGQGASDLSALKRRVLIVDDHPLMRQGLAQLLNQQSDLTVCGEAENVPEALQKTVDLKPDVVIVDLSLKGSDGIELIRSLRSRNARLPLLVLSMHDEALYAERALKAGAWGYIMKQEATNQVLSGLRRVLSGEIHVSHRVSSKIVQGMVGGSDDSERSPIERLSDREFCVFRKIGGGAATKEIAAELRLSVKTIETHCTHIKTKLRLHSQRELVQHAIQWVMQNER
jgi:DNA-binding NarL/FixJ family response regulator